MTTATCPTCKSKVQTYHDKTGAAYFNRHPGKNGRNCAMSCKKAAK